MDRPLELLIELATHRLNVLDKTRQLNNGERWLYRWQFDEAVGSFTEALTLVITRADSSNLVLLHKAYPEHVLAYVGYAHINEFWRLVEHCGHVPAFLKPQAM